MTKIDTKTLNTLVAVDVSGSALDNKLSTKVKSALDMIDGNKINFCTFNTEVQKVFKGISKNSPEIIDLVDQLSLFEPKGTDVKCLVDFALSEGYEQLVVITDGQITKFDEKNLSYVWLIDLDSNRELELAKKSTYYFI